ncbi:MAG: hypothetical protein ACRDMH_02860 [Solirubrobacterales bacterium]
MRYEWTPADAGWWLIEDAREGEDPGHLGPVLSWGAVPDEDEFWEELDSERAEGDAPNAVRIASLHGPTVVMAQHGWLLHRQLQPRFPKHWEEYGWRWGVSGRPICVGEDGWHNVYDPMTDKSYEGEDSTEEAEAP